jgi:hypothetical protein
LPKIQPPRQARIAVAQRIAASSSTNAVSFLSAQNGWKCFEAPGVEPVFLDQEQAIDYAKSRACFRAGEIRILDSSGAIARIIPFDETERKL